MVTQFSEFTGADADVSEGSLNRYKWALEVAMDNYFNDPDSHNKAFQKKGGKKGKEGALFAKYAGKTWGEK